MSIPWAAKQYIAVILALLGFVSTAFSGVVAWSYRELAAEVKSASRGLPLAEERIKKLQEQNALDNATLNALRETIAAQKTGHAVIEQRLKNMEMQLRQILNRLPGIRYDPGDP